MASAWVLKSDAGVTYSMLHTAPRDIKDVLIEGIQRWQCRRAVDHLPESHGETLWPRAVRAIAQRAGAAAEKGALQALWSGGHYTNVWRHDHGYADSEECLACGEMQDTLMHRWCKCPEVMLPRDEELEQEEAFRKPLVAINRQMQEAEQRWTVGDSSLPLSYGLPLKPPLPPTAAAGHTVLNWGGAARALAGQGLHGRIGPRLPSSRGPQMRLGCGSAGARWLPA